MTNALAPERDGAAPRKVGGGKAVGVAAASLLAAILFWSTLLFGGALSGHDWSSHHFHYFDWVRIAFTEFHTLPLYMSDAWVTPNFLANAEAPSLGPLAWLLFALPTGAYIKLLVVVFNAAGLAGMWFLLRDLDVALPVAALVAAMFAWNGFFTSHIGAGHHWAMGAWLLPGLLCLVRRAALGSDAALWGAGAVNAATILGGQHQPFIWQNLLLSLFVLLWALRVRALFPLARWALVLVVSAGLGAVKLLPMWLEFADYAPTARVAGLPAALLSVALLARGQGPDRVEPTLLFEHGAGWWEYAFYLGPVALVCLLVGLVAARRVWPLAVVGAFFVAIALEPSGLWTAIRDLPVWRTQRGPSRFLLPALFALCVVAGLGLGRLHDAARTRWARAAPACAAVLALLAAADLYVESLAWQRGSLGEAIVSLDHRPRPSVVRAGPDVRAELRAFEPNRIVWSVAAARPTRLVLPLRWGKRAAEWRIDPLRALEHEGWLAFELPVGERDVVAVYRPPGLVAGAGATAATIAGFGVWLARRRRRRAAP